MKILSYNIYGVKDTSYPVPEWFIRQENIIKIINNILKDNDIKVACFQEVNMYNIDMLKEVLNKNNFILLDKFAMKTEKCEQYNIIAIRNDKEIQIKECFCLPHGKDKEYNTIDKQIIDYNMSDYRTTVFTHLTCNGKDYLIGNIHTDYISTEGKIKGVIKSLKCMDDIECNYKLLVGDMNMISHMSEVYNILKLNDNYITLSRSENFSSGDNSYHGYGIQEEVNVDFTFIPKKYKENYKYNIVKQNNIFEEGSDHRPIVITVI